ncbi:MAG: SM-20-related protein [Paracoccaceae bacterium]|jgi:SM-20-related protein
MTLNVQKFRDTPLTTDPFDFLTISDFVEKQALDGARASYPEVPGPGSHPSPGLKIEGAFSDLIEQLRGPEFQAAIEEKFNVDLTGRPTMYTVRGYCRERDGKIHPDSKTKIITVLLYMNDDGWDSSGGRLRILRSATDLEDFVAEVEPKGGTLLVFKRADHSWHGHHSFKGQRRAIQLNWVLDQGVVDHEQGRHGFSSKLKKLFGGKK